MIISPRLGFAFFRVPKTASTTAEVMLRLSGVFNSDDILTALPSVQLPERNLGHVSIEAILPSVLPGGQSLANVPEARREFLREANLGHMTPGKAVEVGIVSDEVLAQMRCYAFIRDPAERYLSHYRYVFRNQATPAGFRTYLASNGELPLAPQTNYLTVGNRRCVTPVLFERFEAELRRMIQSIGGFIGQEIPRFKAASGGSSSEVVGAWYDGAALARVRERFSLDFELYDSLTLAPRRAASLSA
jgi:hypothetical protein